MKKKNFIILFTLLILTSLCVSFASAQNKLRLILNQPPPNQLNIADVWSFTLTNITNEPLEVYLKGEAKEEKDGLIATGQTVNIKLNPNESKKMKVSDLPKTPDINYIAKDPRYKESLIRQGMFPSGVYEICVKVFSSGDNEELASDCINQEVVETRILSLINPADGQEIDSKTSVLFTWSFSGKVPEEGYTLKIVEVRTEQSSETAIESNPAFFEMKGIKKSSVNYPNSAKSFEEGKMYAWKVSTNNSNSEVIIFRISTKGSGKLLSNGSIMLTPIGNGCCDSVYINLNGNSYNFFSITSGGVNANTIVSAIPVNSTVNPSTITTPVSSVTWRSLGSAFIQSSYSVGAICFTNISGPFTMVVKFSTNGGATFAAEQIIQVNCPSKPVEPVNDNPCCPPWNKKMLLDMMVYDGSAGISAPYTMHFQPTQVLKDQMQYYLNYVHLLDPSINDITINFRLFDHGTSTVPNVSGTPVDPGIWNSVSWTVGPIGNSLTYITPNFFTGFPMIVGTWYQVRTGIYLNDHPDFFPDECDVSYIFVRIQAMMGIKSTNDPNSSALEFSYDGITVDKTIPIK